MVEKTKKIEKPMTEKELSNMTTRAFQTLKSVLTDMYTHINQYAECSGKYSPTLENILIDKEDSLGGASLVKGRKGMILTVGLPNASGGIRKGPITFHVGHPRLRVPFGASKVPSSKGRPSVSYGSGGFIDTLGYPSIVFSTSKEKVQKENGATLRFRKEERERLEKIVRKPGDVLKADVRESVVVAHRRMEASIKKDIEASLRKPELVGYNIETVKLENKFTGESRTLYVSIPQLKPSSYK